jgi:DNA-binding GntR family transcriptional regulator
VTIMATDSTRALAELDADYTPQFVQVARTVRDRIKDGSYPKFSLVPGSRKLAAEFKVSQLVVLHGLTVLVRAGYLRHVESKPHQVIWDGREEATRTGQSPPRSDATETNT